MNKPPQTCTAMKLLLHIFKQHTNTFDTKISTLCIKILTTGHPHCVIVLQFDLVPNAVFSTKINRVCAFFMHYLRGGGPPLPLPMPCGPGGRPRALPGRGPGGLGPGGRVTGARGFAAAKDTSFWTRTPFPVAAAPGLPVTFGDLLSSSAGFSVIKMAGLSQNQELHCGWRHLHTQVWRFQESEGVSYNVTAKETSGD